MSKIVRRSPYSTIARRIGRYMFLVPPHGNNINTYLPMELMKEIFLYSIESNDMKSGQLASVCRYWRSVITTMSHLWSTLKIGTWTETAQVTTWLQRAYPKKVIIDTERDVRSSSNTPPFAALQDALASTGQWNELTFFSFPPDNVASRLDFQVAGQMKALKVLHVAAGCVQSPSFAHLLDLVPTEAPLTELALHPSFASTNFLQPNWFPVLQKLTVLIVSGKDIDEPFELLPTFTQLQIFEADRLRLPFYEPNTNLPLISTLRKLQVRACSVQWMAGRHFPCLEECTILLPRDWETIQQREVEFPSCKKLSYHGHPMTTAQYFHVPEMGELELRSHDYKDSRVYRQLYHLCTLDGWISKLTTLHLALQCSERAVTNVLKYLSLLQELILSIVHPSPSWQSFLESLAAIPYGTDWPDHSIRVRDRQEWRTWCSSRTWHVNILPHLKHLGIQCPKGFSQSECLTNCPLFRHIGWTRAQLTPPLEHLEVWERRGTTEDIVIDYISAGYLEGYLGISGGEYDQIIVSGMITKCLFVDFFAMPVLSRLDSTILFRRLQELVISLSYLTMHKITILSYLEQIKRLEISGGNIPAYSLQVDLPLTRTLQWLKLDYSTSFWMIGRSFKALREFEFYEQPHFHEFPEGYRGLRVDLPVCTTLKWRESENFFHFLSCPNIQIFHFQQGSRRSTLFEVPQFLIHVSCRFPFLKQRKIRLAKDAWWAHSFLQLVLCEAKEQGVWRDIRSVDVMIRRTDFSAGGFFSEAVGHQQDYEKWWNKVTVTKENADLITIHASV